MTPLWTDLLLGFEYVKYKATPLIKRYICINTSNANNTIHTKQDIHDKGRKSNARF